MRAHKLVPEADQIAIFEELKGILNGYNIDSVADVADVAASTIYFWLDGRTRKPRLDTVLRVAEAVGYTLQLVPARADRATLRSHLRVVK